MRDVFRVGPADPILSRLSGRRPEDLVVSEEDEAETVKLTAPRLDCEVDGDCIEET